MAYYLLNHAPIQSGSVSLEEVPDEFAQIDFNDGLKGKVETLFIESVTDYIEAPFPLVSDRMLDVIRIYQGDVQAKFVSLDYSKVNETLIYWALKPKQIDCLHPETSFSATKGIESLVLKKELIKFEHFFTVGGLQDSFWIVTLEVLESLLRRGMNGFEWEQVAVR